MFQHIGLEKGKKTCSHSSPTSARRHVGLGCCQLEVQMDQHCWEEPQILNSLCLCCHPFFSCHVMAAQSSSPTALSSGVVALQVRSECINPSQLVRAGGWIVDACLRVCCSTDTLAKKLSELKRHRQIFDCFSSLTLPVRFDQDVESADSCVQPHPVSS